MLTNGGLCKNAFYGILARLRSGGANILNKNIFKSLIKFFFALMLFKDNFISKNNHKIFSTAIGGKI
jgi:hypothetical protein